MLVSLQFQEQLAAVCHQRRFQSIVTVGLALHLPPTPRLMQRGRHLVGQPQCLAQVGHPDGDRAGLEHHQFRAFPLQYAAELVR
jgi:hypothetical protein